MVDNLLGILGLSVVLNPVDNKLLATIVGGPQVLWVASGWVALLHNVSQSSLRKALHDF